MKTVWLFLFAASSLSLGILLIRRQAPAGWLTRFGAHLAIAALAIYTLNFSGWVTGWYIPLNPVTIGAAAVLGLPGIALCLGLQTMVLA